MAQQESERKIVALVTDLMFGVRIQGAAKAAGVSVLLVNSLSDLLREAKSGTGLVILDLNERAANALDAISQLKSDAATKDVKLLGYVPHVQVQLKREAEERGCDRVVVRSVFSEKLPQLLRELLSDQ